MYFFNLPGFHPNLGIDLDEQGKYPFLRFEDGVFEKAETDFLSSHFPFQNIADDGAVPVFVSEPNLLSLFGKQSRLDNIIVDHLFVVGQGYVNELRGKFEQGYFEGMKDYPAQIVSTLLNPDLHQKINKLDHFIRFCSDHLFFEGFAVPSCIYALGFIQAYLVRACGERENTLRILPHQPAVVVVAKEPHRPVEVLPRQYDRIPLDYSVDEIISLWLILVDAWKCKPVNSIQVFSTETEVLHLLGMLFEDKDGKLIAQPHQYFEMPPGNYERILNLLMHATYKLNTDRNNIGLERYCQLLIDTFSCYSKTKLESLRSNINKERGNIVQSI
ncbi:hypothetical protein IQ277_33325, partial [Nostocales cyanobacterium LEGE 12452]|nr:hypothetical protein [Nostocales cyanobacterium LEGE 12452]